MVPEAQRLLVAASSRGEHRRPVIRSGRLYFKLEEAIMFSYVDTGKEGLLPRYEELRSLEVVHCGATEPRPGGHVNPPA